MKDFGGCNFLPPDEERRQQRKKGSTTIKLVLVIAVMCSSPAASHGPTSAGERERRSLELVSCPELGPVLGTFHSWDFLHMDQQPQCKDHIKPEMTLYTQKDQSQNCLLLQKDSRNEFSNFDISSKCVLQLQNLEKVVFLVHGFNLLGDDLGQYEEMKTEIIQDRSTGVIIVDWTEGSTVDFSHLQDSGVGSILLDFIHLGPYHQAAANTRYIGAAMAMVTKNIKKVMGQDPFMHCIGHSLGAHACGFLGKALRKLSADPLDRITGLDPAGPLFLESDLFNGEDVPESPSNRLAPEDAILVDTIHTDSTWLGSFTKTGHMDFYIGQQLPDTNMFGYEQPAAVDCFMGSHSLAKDMFLSTIQEECYVQIVCSNINVNLTDNCHSVESVKFGYNIDNSTTTQGSFPVTTDKHELRCLGEKRIQYGSGLPKLLMETLSKHLKGACSLIKSILRPLQALKELLDSNMEKIVQRKLAVDATLQELMSRGSELFPRQDEMSKVHQELLKVDIAYEGHKRVLTNLATITESQTKRIISDLKDIQDTKTKKNNTGDNIEAVLNRMKSLLNYSNKILTEAKQHLETIDIKFAEVKVQLTNAELNIESYKRDVEIQIVNLNANSEALKLKMKKTEDDKRYLGWTLLVGGLFTAAAPLALPWILAVELSMTAVGTGAAGVGLVLVMNEAQELATETRLLEMNHDFKKALTSMEGLAAEYSGTISDFQQKVSGKIKDVKERQDIVSEWYGHISFMIEEYATDDYKKLEDDMKKNKKKELDHAIGQFEELRDISIKYLEYHNNYYKTTTP